MVCPVTAAEFTVTFGSYAGVSTRLYVPSPPLLCSVTRYVAVKLPSPSGALTARPVFVCCSAGGGGRHAELVTTMFVPYVTTARLYSPRPGPAPHAVTFVVPFNTPALSIA